MDDLIRQANTILRSMWKHHWLGLAVAWLVAAIGATVVLRVPDKYEASARIYVDTQSILKPLMSGLAVQPNVDQQIMMLSRTLISRPNVEKVIRMADLDLGSTSKNAQEELIDQLSKGMEIKSTSRDNLYTVTYRNPNPEKAKLVVQSLVSLFVESSLGDKHKDSDSAKKFIDEQIKSYEKKLEDAENRLKEFKLRNIELQTADGKSSSDRLSDISTQLAKARLDLREAENSRDALRRQIVGEQPTSLLPDAPGSDAGISIPDLDGRIDTQKRNLDNLLQRYTEQHPDVVGARRLIKELEEQRRKEIAERKKAAAANPSNAALSANPVYQQLKVSFAEAEANVASLRTRVAEYESRYKQITEVMKAAPEIEAEFAQLNRDYDIQKKNYEALVSRRESASLSGELDSVAGVADFRLIDPPRVSPHPVSPNRTLLLPLVLLASLAAGLVASFLAGQFRPVFFDGKTLREVAGLPLLGSVTAVVSDEENRKTRSDRRRFIGGFAALIAVFAAGIAFLFVISSRGV